MPRHSLNRQSYQRMLCASTVGRLVYCNNEELKNCTYGYVSELLAEASSDRLLRYSAEIVSSLLSRTRAQIHSHQSLYATLSDNTLSEALSHIFNLCLLGMYLALGGYECGLESPLRIDNSADLYS